MTPRDSDARATLTWTDMTHPLRCTLKELTEAIHAKRVSPTELMAMTLDRIDETHDRLNAIVARRTREDLMAAARLAEDRIGRGLALGRLSQARTADRSRPARTRAGHLLVSNAPDDAPNDRRAAEGEKQRGHPPLDGVPASPFESGAEGVPAKQRSDEQTGDCDAKVPRHTSNVTRLPRPDKPVGS
jgi:hypothetical protein